MSMRKEFSKNLSWISIVGLCVFVIIMVIHLSVGFRLISENFTKGVLKQMVQALQSQYEITYSFLGEPYILVEAENEENSINLLDYAVKVDEVVVFESNQESNLFDQVILTSNENPLIRWINPIRVVAFEKTSTNSQGEIAISLNSKIIYWIFIIEIIVSLIAFIIVYIVAQLLAWKLSHSLVVPLTKLDEKITLLSRGDVETVLSHPIELQNPLKEIDLIATHTNDLVTLIKSQIDLLEVKNSMIQQKMTELSIIFNQIDQGILYFDDQLKIQPTYSKMCKDIFKKNIEDCRMSELLYQSSDDRQFVEELLNQIFNGPVSEREVLLSLLPDALEINELSVLLSYKMIYSSENTQLLMVILTDVTDKKRLTNLMETEQKQLKMIVKSLIHSFDLNQLIEDYKQFAQEVQKDEFQCHHEALTREIHTFKGSFSLFDFEHTVVALNELEDQLILAMKQQQCIELSEETLLSLLKEDVDIIENYTNRNYLTGQMNEQNGLKSFKEQLSYFSDYVQKLAEQFDKSIHPFEIEGDDFLMDPNEYKYFIRSLIHLFRNSVDHGIESIEERILADKPETAQIQCRIETYQDSFKLVIQDDGRGIDVTRLRQKMEVLNPELLENLNEADLIQLVFEQGLTTKDHHSLISGKGIGLSAVKNETEKMGGSIFVESEQNRGTTFTIQIPFKNDRRSIEFEAQMSQFMNQIVETASKVIWTKILPDTSVQPSVIHHDANIRLLDYTTVIPIGKPLEILVLVSMNEVLTRQLGKDVLTLDEIHQTELLHDVISETSNVIVGNALNQFDGESYAVAMGAPVMVESRGQNSQHIERVITSMIYEVEKYQLEIHFVSIQNLNE